ncbi:hypothetical protein SLEP1_g54796 [Rubroshorea leprosula]|uniref:Uncharacterized protein n=1 Tax=Rubroshorea leprosula TaxID=152421 RepID=A0AAV5ME53_9ROSI|nr:hypothetical protein SLEP1_g54796 [Rubroshorea leprosula]
MGAYRIGDVREVNRKYYDRDVCRLYLSSLWPHKLFQLTKQEKYRKRDWFSWRECGSNTSSGFCYALTPKNGYGAMSKGRLFVAEERVSLYYSQCWMGAFLVVAKAKGIDNYDRELEEAIDRLIVECDRKIGRALKCLEDEDAKAVIAISVSEVTQTAEVLELSKQIKEKLKEAFQYGIIFLH